MTLSPGEEIENQLAAVAMERYEPNVNAWGYLSVAIGDASISHQALIDAVAIVPLFKGLPKEKAIHVFQEIADRRVLILDMRSVYRSAKQIEELFETPFPPIQVMEVRREG